MDAIQMLLDQHREVDSLFERFEKGDAAQQGEIVNELTQKLTIHAQLEEKIFYPTFRTEARKQDLVLEAIEEHHVVKFVLNELARMDGSEENYKAKVTLLKELVQHHVAEEEQEMLPLAKTVLSQEVLDTISDQMMRMKADLEAQGPQISVTMIREFEIEQRERRSSK